MNNIQRTLIYKAILEHKECCKAGDCASATNNASDLFRILQETDPKLKAMVDAENEKDADIDIMKAKIEFNKRILG